MPDTSKSSVLTDHKRKKKKLIPPLLAAMGDIYSPFSWARELVPELLWIALLQQELGLEKGKSFALEIARDADLVYERIPKPYFCKISTFDMLSDEQRIRVRNLARDHTYFREALTALRALFILLPQCPLAFLASGDLDTNGTESEPILELLPKVYDRKSREAALTMSTAIEIGLRQGKIIIAKEDLATKLQEDFVSIVDYPETDESRGAASSFRAMIAAFLKGPNAENDTENWLEIFWNQVAGFGSCEVLPDEEEAVPRDELGKTIFRFRNAALREMRERIDKWGFDLNCIEQYEVIGALIARQTTLASELASAPAIWTAHSAPLFLRSMADVYITLAWIIKDPQKRCEKFVDDGLGAIKLEIEHRKQEQKKLAEKPGDPEAQLIQFWEHWLSSQRLEDFVEVNLGSWSGTTTRKMAEEAGCLDFYNYVYQPFSSAVHSMWPHISTQNMTYCTNPAHRFHRVPIYPHKDINPHWLWLAAKYLQKAFSAFDDFAKIKIVSSSAFEQLEHDLNKMTKHRQ